MIRFFNGTENGTYKRNNNDYHYHYVETQYRRIIMKHSLLALIALTPFQASAAEDLALPGAR